MFRSWVRKPEHDRLRHLSPQWSDQPHRLLASMLNAHEQRLNSERNCAGRPLCCLILLSCAYSHCSASIMEYFLVLVARDVLVVDVLIYIYAEQLNPGPFGPSVTNSNR